MHKLSVGTFFFILMYALFLLPWLTVQHEKTNQCLQLKYKAVSWTQTCKMWIIIYRRGVISFSANLELNLFLWWVKFVSKSYLLLVKIKKKKNNVNETLKSVCSVIRKIEIGSQLFFFFVVCTCTHIISCLHAFLQLWKKNTI